MRKIAADRNYRLVKRAFGRVTKAQESIAASLAGWVLDGLPSHLNSEPINDIKNLSILMAEALNTIEANVVTGRAPSSGSDEMENKILASKHAEITSLVASWTKV